MTTGRINQVTIRSREHPLAGMNATTTRACALSRLDFHCYKAIITPDLDSQTTSLVDIPNALRHSTRTGGSSEKAPNAPFSQSLEAISWSLRTKVMSLGEDYQRTAKL
ncbi:hypothetical protein RhiJN_27223 [Ceratobasidium sp. AG-Ba]|nr:hypothetical protein RhiJN_27221 [Ceratobasidium sp. AG-Ba]QRV99203.1 hypothetical protein RhiJN_27222 [Ceratobasidium sp. AG-Ba]QRV99204.1 hypothetical protein RhiJN_27223 [Ceratobasidium sp. AG-Ba]